MNINRNRTNFNRNATTRARRVYANTETMDTEMPEMMPPVEAEPSELLFQVEDVAEIIETVTGENTDATVNEDNTVTFTVGEESYTVEPDGTEEVVESCNDVMSSYRPVAAAKRSAMAARKPIRPVSAAKKTASRGAVISASRRPQTSRSGRTMRSINR